MELKSRKVLEGKGASRGSASGPVRIVFNIQQLDRLQLGEVLVTPMTNPDMVVAMAKAVAVVTDVGGMTCHAAIISRELGIPCVVGTQRATKVLVDGMLIRVDGTNGFVYQLSFEEREQIQMQKLEKEKFKIFGTEVESVIFKTHRNKPLWPEGWDVPWQEFDTESEYEWVPPRPEVPTTPLTVSMIMPGVERISYALGLNVGPLYASLYDCVLHIRLDKIRQVLALLADKLIRKDEKFVRSFESNLYIAYREFDEASDLLRKRTRLLENMRSSDIIEAFKDWWRVHQRFFSLTFMIQSMGDDIVWPYIERILIEKLSDRSESLDYISILSLPLAEVTSTRFFDGLVEIMNSAPRNIRSLIFSNVSIDETIKAAGELEKGKEWLDKFTEFVKEWGWMRDRDLYFQPLNNIVRILEFVRRHLSPNVKPSNLEENHVRFEKCLEELKKLMPEDFMFYVEIGKFLHTERDVHHHLWLKNTITVRSIFLELGKRLAERDLFYDPRDVFFVFVPELFELFSNNIQQDRKQEIMKKIPNRMVANTLVSKIHYHDRPGYNPDKVPQRDGEYY